MNPSRKTRSILLVEDNPADAGLVCEALQAHEVECDLLILSDGAKAIRYIEALEQPAACPAMIIVDLNLPKRSGREVVQSIRENVHCSDVKIVIMSSSDAEQDRAIASSLNVNRYLQKPLRLGEFLDLGAIFKQILEG